MLNRQEFFWRFFLIEMTKYILHLFKTTLFVLKYDLHLFKTIVFVTKYILH